MRYMAARVPYVALATAIGARGVQAITDVDERTVTSWSNAAPFTNAACREVTDEANLEWRSLLGPSPVPLPLVRALAPLLCDSFGVPPRTKPEKRYDYSSRIRSKGLSLDEYDSMLRTQCGRCAICEGPPTLNRRLAIDHDHRTGRVRGLLCHHCNTMLGNVRDSVPILRRAISYLSDVSVSSSGS